MIDRIALSEGPPPLKARFFEWQYKEENEEMEAADSLRQEVEKSGTVKRFWTLEHRYPGCALSELKDYEGLPKALKQAYFSIEKYQFMRRIAVLVEFE